MVTQYVGQAVTFKASCPYPSLCPSLPPLRRTWPPVALVPRAESQTTARVRSNSREKRLAAKLRACWAGGDSGETPSPGLPLFSLCAQSVKSRPETAGPRPRSAGTRSHPAHAREMQTHRDAHGREMGPSRQECAAPTGCPVRFSGIPWIPNPLEPLSGALLQELGSQNANSRFPGPQKGS